MTVKIKELKEQPLLAPPGLSSEDWMRTRPQDIEIIENSLATYRKKDDDAWGGDIAMLQYSLKKLGGNYEVTDKDRSRMEGHLKQWRDKQEVEHKGEIKNILNIKLAAPSDD